MTAAVFDFPGAQALAEPQGLNLTEQEVIDACGGYVQPARQLQALHELGFTRAYIAPIGKKRVVLERAHYDAVVRGHFGAGGPQQPEPARPAPHGNRARLSRFLKSRGK